MSRYPTKRELTDVVRSTIAADHNQTGLPTDVGRYNLSGILRDLDVMGDGYHGYTFRHYGREPFVEALRNNLRTG